MEEFDTDEPSIEELGLEGDCTDEIEVADESHNDILTMYLGEIGVRAILTKEQEHLLGTRIKNGDQSAVSELVAHNLRLVVSFAKKYSNRDILEDIIQEGNLGLYHAATKFDVDKGVRFSTYASWWIKQSIDRYLMNYSTIRLPVHVHKESRALVTFLRGQKLELDKEGVAAAAKHFEMDVDTVHKKLNYYGLTVPVSMDTPIEDGLTIGDVFIAENMDLESLLTQGETVSKISSYLCKLTPNQRIVIIARYGLVDDPMTLGQIADLLGITREGVRQIEIRARSILKNLFLNDGIVFEDVI